MISGVEYVEDIGPITVSATVSFLLNTVFVEYTSIDGNIQIEEFQFTGIQAMRRELLTVFRRVLPDGTDYHYVYNSLTPFINTVEQALEWKREED